MFRKYLQYAKSKVSPQITKIDSDKISQVYAELRQESMVGVAMGARGLTVQADALSRYFIWVPSTSNVTVSNVNFGDSRLAHISISGMNVVEGNSGTKTINVQVHLEGSFGAPVTVNYATQDGSDPLYGAKSGEDYQAASGTFTFPSVPMPIAGWSTSLLKSSGSPPVTVNLPSVGASAARHFSTSSTGARFGSGSRHIPHFMHRSVHVFVIL
jgi:hypothetical protein